MAIGDGDVNGAVLQRRTVCGVHGWQGAIAVDDAGQHAGSARRHVQRHQYRIGEIWGQSSSELGERFHPAGRSTYRHHVERRVFA